VLDLPGTPAACDLLIYRFVDLLIGATTKSTNQQITKSTNSPT
jgi:hypothetical protein